jgi:hypothetical protein
MRKIIWAVAAVSGVALASPAFATSTGPSAAPRPRAVTSSGTDLTLSYMADAGYAAAVRLTCTSADVHPQAKEACATLKKAGGDPAGIVPADTMCTMEYAPITAAVSGTWAGKTIGWSQRFGNRCTMHQATGVLFAF